MFCIKYNTHTSTNGIINTTINYKAIRKKCIRGKYGKILLIYVKGHANIIKNEVVESLQKQACDQKQVRNKMLTTDRSPFE